MNQTTHTFKRYATKGRSIKGNIGKDQPEIEVNLGVNLPIHTKTTERNEE